MIVPFLTAATFANSLLHPEQSIFCKWAVYAFFAVNAFFGLFHTFFVFNLRKYLPERDDE
jgi:hypothetical protein